MDRVIKAFFNSMRALAHLGRTEKAVQQELAVLALSFPAAWFVAQAFWHGAALVGSIVFVLIVEILNTGIEAACNAVSREFHADIRIAKDAGSLAVLLSILMAVGVWGNALWLRFA
jgi:diacylglycerol kinase (ATP)